MKLSKGQYWAPPYYNQGLSEHLVAACHGLVRAFVSLVLWSLPVFISSAFAQTAPAAAAGGDMQSSLMSMLPLVLMFVLLLCG